MSQKPQIILLAGGKSRRFWPIENKLTLKFLGRSWLEWQIDKLINLGFSEIILVSTKDIIERFAGRHVKGVIQQGGGQAAAIISAQDLITDRPILVVNANDLVESKLFKNLLKIIDRQHNVLVGVKVKDYFPGGYLVLNGNTVVKVVEKPGEGKEPSNYVKLVCDYFQNGRQLITAIQSITSTNADSLYELALSNMMRQGIKFDMLEYQDIWIPLKYPWQILLLMNYLLSQIKKSIIHSSAKIHKTTTISGPVILEKGVRVMEYSKLVGPMYVGTGTIIGNHCLVRQSLIGKECVIGFSSDITRSYIGNNCWFHTNYIGDSVVADEVTLGAGTILANLRFDEGKIYSLVQNQRIYTGLNKFGAIIGYRTRIGIESQVMPGIKIGQNCIVGPGIILQQDLSNNQRCYIKQSYLVEGNLSQITSNRQDFKQKL